MGVSCIVSEIKRDIGRKLRFFHTPAFDPLLGYCHTVWYETRNFATANRSHVRCAYNTSRLYSNSVTLKYRLGVVQGHLKWRRLIDYIIIYDFLLVGNCNYSSILCHFRVINFDIIATLKSGLEVTQYH